MNLKPDETAFWNAYLNSVRDEESLHHAVVTAGYAGSPQITDDLLALYLAGKKTAGSSLLEDYLATGDPLPRVGNFWICLNGRGEPSAILRTERIVMNKFKDVPVEIAIAEGEGDLSLEYWRRVHAQFWGPHLAGWKVSDLNEATVVTEFLTVVHRGSVNP